MNDLTPWIEIAKAVPSVVTAVTAVIGVAIAVRGLNKWRAETTGKRNAQLAEEVLADFYRAKAIFEWARDIDTPGGEGEAGKAEPGEKPEETRYRNALYAPIQRLIDQNEFFAAMAARRFRFKAVFGAAADKPFTDLAIIQNQIFTAARRLIAIYRDTPLNEPPQRAKWEAVIGWPRTDDDPIATRLEAIIDNVEQLCRPHIMLGGNA
jgi:hypothetical protein